MQKQSNGDSILPAKSSVPFMIFHDTFAVYLTLINDQFRAPRNYIRALFLFDTLDRRL